MSAISIDVPILAASNSPEEVAKRLEAGKISHLAPWLVLPMRTVLFVLTQALTAVALLLAGSQNPWKESIYWWPVYLIIPNLITLAVLVYLTGREGLAYSALWKYVRSEGPFISGQEILAGLGVLIVGGLGFMGAPLLLYRGKMPDFVGALPMWAASRRSDHTDPLAAGTAGRLLAGPAAQRTAFNIRRPLHVVSLSHHATPVAVYRAGLPALSPAGAAYGYPLPA